jgi:3D (Asp-Asp-Asp) domain-containing protein
MTRTLCALAALSTLVATTGEAANDRHGPMEFEATAYSIEGETASGATTREGIVAADPDVLPLGSRIHVSRAGAYSGVYVVHDTGRTIRGREIDLYLDGDAEAKRFGRRRVTVEVLRWGDGERIDATSGRGKQP